MGTRTWLNAGFYWRAFVSFPVGLTCGWLRGHDVSVFRDLRFFYSSSGLRLALQRQMRSKNGGFMSSIMDLCIMPFCQFTLGRWSAPTVANFTGVPLALRNVAVQALLPVQRTSRMYKCIAGGLLAGFTFAAVRGMVKQVMFWWEMWR